MAFLKATLHCLISQSKSPDQNHCNVNDIVKTISIYIKPMELLHNDFNLVYVLYEISVFYIYFIKFEPQLLFTDLLHITMELWE